ncbi:hypothetical protein PAPYR_1755 [Paratrimastix pyriformis]|uniref:Uncharacterized protein n=1 Tax=Paratrimastix pyriformis TaxID=342808 RepID=A0ABQ8UV81_9EUKA|nr:hypothetical protein PAPYR_1755 [Paratrimastix pyriformis]
MIPLGIAEPKLTDETDLIWMGGEFAEQHRFATGFIDRYASSEPLYKTAFQYLGPPPGCNRVEIKIQGVPDRFQMRYDTAAGLWRRNLFLPAGPCFYVFIVNNLQWVPDPADVTRIKWADDGQVWTRVNVQATEPVPESVPPPALMAAVEDEVIRQKHREATRQEGLGQIPEEAAGIGSDFAFGSGEAHKVTGSTMVIDIQPSLPLGGG